MEAEEEAAEVEAAEVEAAEEAAEEEEEDKQTPKTRLTSDSAETPRRYSQERGRKQIASSHNSNVITWPTSESQNSTPGSEKSSSLAPTFKAHLSTNGLTER